MHFYKELNCVSANKNTIEVSPGVPCRSKVKQIRHILMALPEDFLHAGIFDMTKIHIK